MARKKKKKKVRAKKKTELAVQSSTAKKNVVPKEVIDIALIVVTLMLTGSTVFLFLATEKMNNTEKYLFLEQNRIAAGDELSLANDLVYELEDHKFQFDEIKSKLPGIENTDEVYKRRLSTTKTQQAIGKVGFGTSSNLRKKLSDYMKIISTVNFDLDAIQQVNGNAEYKSQYINETVRIAAAITEQRLDGININELIQEAKDYADRTNACYIKINQHMKNETMGVSTTFESCE